MKGQPKIDLTGATIIARNVKCKQKEKFENLNNKMLLLEIVKLNEKFNNYRNYLKRR